MHRALRTHSEAGIQDVLSSHPHWPTEEALTSAPPRRRGDGDGALRLRERGCWDESPGLLTAKVQLFPLRHAL